MKEFLKSNTVTYNLMAFTAFKSILIFSLLTESPKTYAQIQEAILNHEYLHEQMSVDTIRNYINTLKEVGCNIVCTKEQYGPMTFSIANHPFELNISEKQVKSILKIYKAISKSIDVHELIALHNFFNKISTYIKNEELKLKLQNISPLNNIDQELIKDLIEYSANNAEITILYNSPNSGHKQITILADKLEIINGKLYLFGISSEYNTYSRFLVYKILEILNVNLNNKTIDIPDIVVGYEYTKDDNENLELLDNETIVKQDGNKYLIELTSKSKFDIMQRILYHMDKCKVLYPANIKSEVITTLKKMKEGYIGN